MVLLDCEHITKRYGKFTALNDVSFQIESGRIVGLLGPNGSGKTTTIKLINGLLTPNSGTILIDGHRPGKESHAIVSYLPERTYFEDWMSARQTLNYFEDFYRDFDRPRAEQMLANLNISTSARIRQMSKGTREKLQLVLVMSRRAELYLLDEPIGGVDPATRDYILHTILSNYEQRSAILISTHLIQDIEPVLDDVIFLKNGQIAEQCSKEQILREKGMSVDAYFREVFKCSEN